MYRFFVNKENIDTVSHRVTISGDDYNHIKNVLRMKNGEEINISDGESDLEYRCRIEDFTEEAVECSLCFIKEGDFELPSRIYLFQGLPKQDKMELIIQKCVELGVYEVVPVSCHRSVVKLDDKKAKSKTARWQGIAEAAAKQSKRGIIPEVSKPVSFKEAVKYAKENCSLILLPYEMSDADTMEKTRQLIAGVNPGESIAVFIGPEGGFEDSEVSLLKENGAEVITLGHRILRTETAGLCVMSWLMFFLDGKR